MEIQTKGAVMSPRYPQSLLTPVPPCSWTYVGDVLFICCTVLGRQTLRETKEKVSVGTPPGGAKHLLLTTITLPDLPVPWVCRNPWDLRTTFQDFCLNALNPFLATLS